MIFSQIIYCIIGLTLLHLLITKKVSLFQVYVFLLPFHSWYFKIGLNLFASQIIIILMMITIFLVKPGKGRSFFSPNTPQVTIYFAFSVIVTVIMTLIYHGQFLDLGGFFRSEGRFISQIILLALSLSIIPLSYNYLKRLKDVKSTIKTFLNAVLVLTILGWFQLVIFYLFHYDIFPLALSKEGIIRSGVWNTSGFNFFRMSSLGGEPKSLSITFVLGFFILKVFNKNNLFIYGKFDKVIKLMLLISTIATASTSGLALLIILYISDFLFDLFRSKIRLRTQNILFAILTFGIFISIISVYWEYVSVYINARLLDRNLVGEDFDYPIQKFFIDHTEFLLFGTGLGNAHNFAHPYIPSETSHYMVDSIFVAKSGYLKLISEIGIIGFFIFCLIPLSIYSKLQSFRRKTIMVTEEKFLINSFQSLLFLFFLGFLARSYMLNELLLIFAIGFCIIKYKRIINYSALVKA